MKLRELKTELEKYLYMPDNGVLEIIMAATLAARMQLGQPVWIVVVGVSSGGKSQLIRPLSDDKFIYRVDDLTENTLISGMKSEENSLLLRVGPSGVLVFSDLTALFSKSQEARDAILGQLRLVYDGEMTKFFGNQKPIHWHGTLGVVAGSTPSIYRHFEQVADMGERFIYYRMKAVDPQVATDRALTSPLYGRELDKKISELYTEFQQSVMASEPKPVLADSEKERIKIAALLAAQMRTPIHLDYKTGAIDRIPFSEMPMRVALQFSVLAKGLSAIQFHETGSYELSEEQLSIIDWCSYSLANEERRACLRVICQYQLGDKMSTQFIANGVGLDTAVMRRHLQALAAIGILQRETGSGENLKWLVVDPKTYQLVRKMEGITSEKPIEGDEEFGGF